DAITMDQHGLPHVIVDKCTACGDCVNICPKQLFSLQPISRKLWMACLNEADPLAAEAVCEVACTACGKCVVDSATGLIELKNNLAVIDYNLNEQADRHAIERCPTGAIVWLEGGHIDKGHAAKKIIRIKPLPVMAEA